MIISNKFELNEYRKISKHNLQLYDCRILICSGTGCIATGSKNIYKKILKIIKNIPNVIVDFLPNNNNNNNKYIGIKNTGCQGICELGPLVRIQKKNRIIQYIKVKVDDCEEIINSTVINDNIIDRLLYKSDKNIYIQPDKIPFIAKQTRIVLENCGKYDSSSIDEYIASGGFKALEKVLFNMTPKKVIEEIKKSGLRGRGGGGFPTGKKWEQVYKQIEKKRYVVCNGDEGDPGAFMDGSVMEGDPFKLIEGIMISGYAVKSNDGYIYVRAEYPNSISMLTHAINIMKQKKILGDNILGTDFSFNIHINKGAGAFVCGEGSALTSSIEGNRGFPRIKPPRTVEHGLWYKPTVLNNVETYANVPNIIINGYKWFRLIGTKNSPGTKTYSLTGSIKNTGLIEVPMGTTLRTIIYEIGNGIQNNYKFKAVQIGGPSGGCLTSKHLDEPLDFDSIKKFGVIIGSGGLVIMDNRTCMVEVARFFMNFTQRESCGKCTPCRIGTKRMLEILEKIISKHGELSDIENLKNIANNVKILSLCGLGKSAPIPILSTMNMFYNEYIDHITNKKCTANSCNAFKNYYININVCKKCNKCLINCPVNAIKDKNKYYIIDTKKCIKCGTCIKKCNFNAIEIK